MQLPSRKDAFLGLVIGVVTVTVIGGLVMLGSPGEARVRRLDERRVADLQAIARATNVYRTRHGRLPPSLEELAQEAGMRVDLRDPTTAERYSYRTVDSLTYELCARFERVSRGGPDDEPQWGGDVSWPHGVGRQCFEREARDVRH
jgi:type II secretory pathway pseudopilin PulG